MLFLTFLQMRHHNDAMVTYEETIEYLERRERQRQNLLDIRYRKALKDFEKIVSYIISRHKPSGIWQWGSLLNRKNFTEVSDLDIALEGLSSPGEIFTILARAEEMTDFPLDIVELEKMEPEYRELIKKKGKCIYGCI